MCVIFVGKRRHIESLDLDAAWDMNGHGAGMIIPGKQATAVKGLMKPQDVELALRSVYKNQMIVLHFRYATHGAPSQGNTHPFNVTKNTFLMHNGVLEGLGIAGDKGMSDSAHLASILRKLSPRERDAILRSLDGKFVMVTNRDVQTYGHFHTRNHVRCSNVSWDMLPLYGAPYGSSVKVTTLQQLEAREAALEALDTRRKAREMLEGFESIGDLTDPFHVGR